jgi:hypothetical protein
LIKALEGMDRIAAAGLLARAALSLGYADSQAAQSLRGEEQLRRTVIDEIRSGLGLAADDNSADSVERVADALDSESDRLLGTDIESALKRLAERGDLPSDLYEINIIPNITRMLGKRFELEKDIIETTVREPLAEQHYGPPRAAHEPAMISLFLRPFRTRWPLRDFVMLVAAQRQGLTLDVHQAWRIYPQIVDIGGAAAPVDWLRRFASAFGANVEVEGNKSHFFLFTSGKVPDRVKWEVPPRKEYLISRFAQRDTATGVEQSALVVAIDIKKYVATLDTLGVKRKDFLGEFVPAPRPTA